MRMRVASFHLLALVVLCCREPHHGVVSSFVIPSTKKNEAFVRIVANNNGKLAATVARDNQGSIENEVLMENKKVADTTDLMECMSKSQLSSQQWAEMFDLSQDDGNFYSLFEGIRKCIPLGLKGLPFVLRKQDIEAATGGKSFDGYFTMQDLEKAVNDDFLDAGRGTTDSRKGWKMHTVSNPRGQSFQDARMTFRDVELALEKGTVIFNSAGGHIPKLAAATLACTDATCLPSALNLYATSPGMRTSAPPHTDKQDVVVVQTLGSKFWQVYSPPDPSRDVAADMFARGKGDDDLPKNMLSQLGCRLLLETTLSEGDVLFIPAAFPHTTATVRNEQEEEKNDVVSIHLTFGLDNRIWDLDYLSLRRLALKRAHVRDTKLGQTHETDNHYTGAVNELPETIRTDALEALPLGLLDEENNNDPNLVDTVVAELQRVAQEIDEDTYSKVDPTIWKETTLRVQQHGRELLEIHRDMYLSAIEEGRIRDEEAQMTAHLKTQSSTLTPEQMQRLSVFRVKRHFDKIAEINKSLMDWSLSGARSEEQEEDPFALPDNWAFVMPVHVGDEVEADLGGAFFPARVSRIAGDTYDVEYFDGDRDTGLLREQIKLLVPPKIEAPPDESTLTKKELKRLRKKEEKQKRKKKNKK